MVGLVGARQQLPTLRGAGANVLPKSLFLLTPISCSVRSRLSLCNLYETPGWLCGFCQPPVRKASGFPQIRRLYWRLGRPRQSLCFLANGKPEAFRTGGGKSRKINWLPMTRTHEFLRRHQRTQKEIEELTLGRVSHLRNLPAIPSFSQDLICHHTDQDHRAHHCEVQRTRNTE